MSFRKSCWLWRCRGCCGCCCCCVPRRGQPWRRGISQSCLRRPSCVPKMFAVALFWRSSRGAGTASGWAAGVHRAGFLRRSARVPGMSTCTLLGRASRNADDAQSSEENSQITEHGRRPRRRETRWSMLRLPRRASERTWVRRAGLPAGVRFAAVGLAGIVGVARRGTVKNALLAAPRP